MQENNSYISNLVEDNLKLVSYVIKKYYPGHIGDEDMFQCGCIGLMKAAQKYDESRGAFSTYASLFIRMDIKVSIRDKYALKRKVHLNTFGLDHSNSIEDGFEDKIINNSFVKQLLNNTELRNLERQCIEMYYFQGFNQVEISKALNNTNISRIINIALKKLKENASQGGNQVMQIKKHLSV